MADFDLGGGHAMALFALFKGATKSASIYPLILGAQFFRAGGQGEVGGLVNLHYGQDRAWSLTHLSDQFARPNCCDSRCRSKSGR